MSAQIIDFRSGKLMETKQDTEANDVRASVDGTYIGRINKSNAKQFREHVAIMEAMIEQVQELQEVLQEMQDIHEANFEMVEKMLKVEVPPTKDLMVDENGHVWMVDVAGEEEEV